MSTPYTLMRCRMKDLISCFNACKVVEKDDESSDRHHNNKPNPSSSSSSTSNNSNINIDGHENKRDKKQMEAVTTAKNDSGFESPTSWQSCESEEDEYIVFYFKNDDTGEDVIEESRGLESSTARQQHVSRRKKHEKGKMQADHARWVPREIRERKETEEHLDILKVTRVLVLLPFQHLWAGLDPLTNCRIQREWPGSPVLMPRPEGHNKPRSVCIKCCKF